MEEDKTGKAQYRITSSAYSKIVLHSAKYVSAVHGILLGKTVDRVIHIVDSLPVAHSSGAVYTTPLTETALLLCDAYANDKGLQLVGVYFGNEVADDNSIDVVPTRLADKILENFRHACLLMINGKMLSPLRRKTQHCLRVCTRDPKYNATWAKGTLDPNALSVPNKVLEKCHNYLNVPEMVQSIADFEEHCANQKADWLNADLFQFEGEYEYSSK